MIKFIADLVHVFDLEEPCQVGNGGMLADKGRGVEVEKGPSSLM